MGAAGLVSIADTLATPPPGKEFLHYGGHRLIMLAQSDRLHTAIYHVRRAAEEAL